MTGNSFVNNATSAIGVDLTSNPTITGNSVTSNGVNGVILDSGSLTVNSHWTNPDILYWFTGGDTNNDQAGSGPALGNSGVIQFSNTSAAHVMNHVEVRYGGFNSAAAVETDGAPLSFTNSVIRNSSSAGLRITSSNPIVTGSTISNNSGSAISMDLASAPKVSGNTISNHNLNGVRLDSGTLPGDTAWNNSDIVYDLSDDVMVPVGTTLSIGAGQVKLSPSSVISTVPGAIPSWAHAHECSVVPDANHLPSGEKA